MDAVLPAPASSSGFATTRKTTATATATTGAPLQIQHSATDTASRLAAEPGHDASLDRDAPADSAPTAPTKSTPQPLSSAQLLPAVTAGEVAKLQRRDEGLAEDFFADASWCEASASSPSAQSSTTPSRAPSNQDEGRARGTQS